MHSERLTWRQGRRRWVSSGARRRRGLALSWGLGLTLGVGGGLTACSPNDLVSGANLPSTVTDPAALQTPAGALAAYHGTLVAFRDAFSEFIQSSGVLADELQTGDIGEPLGTPLRFETALDSRVFPEGAQLGVDLLYSFLQRVRGQSAQARGLLRDYLPGDSARALVGQLYALEGYSELFLAELYCSGIPLSTLDYGGDYTLQPGSPTTDVLQHALTRFDSALALSGDSARILNLARVGRGRALVALGAYASAAAAVAPVPDDFRYHVFYTPESARGANFALVPNGVWSNTVADTEGHNGLDYRTSGDPRTASTAAGTNAYGRTHYHPDKYDTTGASPIVLADGVEARLIEAEAALQGGDPTAWRATLNHLRQTAWPTIQPAVAGPLDTLSDPGSDTARVSLTFRERAFWLFLTGHRQGDLRRLIRQYGRLQSAVFPSGPYPGASGHYGTDVTVPIPPEERTYNPRFTGCQSRGA